MGDDARPQREDREPRELERRVATPERPQVDRSERSEERVPSRDLRHRTIRR